MKENGNETQRGEFYPSKEIILDDIPENVFSQAEKMKNIGLDIPQTSELIYLLGKEGIKLDSHIITEEKCVAENMFYVEGDKIVHDP